MAATYKTERRSASQSQRSHVSSDPEEPMTFRRTRYRASDAPSQTSTGTEHYLEILDTSLNEVQVERTSSNRDAESASATMDYQNPGLTYEGLDQHTVEAPPEPSASDPDLTYEDLHQNSAFTPSEPSVYDPGSTYEGLDRNTMVVPPAPSVYDDLNNG